MFNLPDIAPAFLQHSLLRDDVLGAVLWPLPVLKVSKDISSILSALPQTSDMLSFLPRLLRSYTTVVQTHQRELFVQPTSSRSSYGTYLQDRTRSTLNTAVREIKAALRLIEGNEVSLSEPGWSCRERIWQAIAQSGLYLEVDPSWTSLLAEDTQAASVVLRGQPAIGLVRSVMLFLTSAEKLDHVATAVTSSSLAWCLAVGHFRSSLTDSLGTNRIVPGSARSLARNASLPSALQHCRSMVLDRHKRTRSPCRRSHDE
jgi:hypothetical protein